MKKLRRQADDFQCLALSFLSFFSVPMRTSPDKEVRRVTTTSVPQHQGAQGLTMDRVFKTTYNNDHKTLKALLFTKKKYYLLLPSIPTCPGSNLKGQSPLQTPILEEMPNPMDCPSRLPSCDTLCRCPCSLPREPN